MTLNPCLVLGEKNGEIKWKMTKERTGKDSQKESNKRLRRTRD